MNRAESKYFHTAEKMEDALLSLLGEKDFAYITVKDICTRAKVNRSTFYLHYENTAELLSEVVASTDRRFRASIPEEVRSGTEMPREETFFMTDRYLLPYLEFVKANRRIYKAAHEQGEVFALEANYDRMFQTVFSPILSRYGVPREMHRYMMAFYRHGLSAVLMKWVEGDCKENTVEVAGLLRRCVGGEGE